MFDCVLRIWSSEPLPKYALPQSPLLHEPIRQHLCNNITHSFPLDPGVAPLDVTLTSAESRDLHTQSHPANLETMEANNFASTSTLTGTDNRWMEAENNRQIPCLASMGQMPMFPAAMLSQPNEALHNMQPTPGHHIIPHDQATIDWCGTAQQIGSVDATGFQYGIFHFPSSH
jgi:hypothetical protein